jgi:uncharacterized protein (DUF1015 family)
MADPSLIVWPIHRMIECNPQAVFNGLQELCTFTKSASLDTVLQWVNAGTEPGRLGCYFAKQFYTVSAKPAAVQRWLAQPTVDRACADLDVSVLQQWLFAHAGIAHEAIHYWADPQRAVREVDHQAADMAWFLRGIPLQRVYDLARAGHMLAQKSTYFYPKVPSGLAINPHQGVFKKYQTLSAKSA